MMYYSVAGLFELHICMHIAYIMDFTSAQGRRHEFSTGRGTDSGELKPPIPKFRFLVGFCLLYFCIY